MIPPPEASCPDVSRCQEDSSSSPQNDDGSGGTLGSEPQTLEGDEISSGCSYLNDFTSEIQVLLWIVVDFIWKYFLSFDRSSGGSIFTCTGKHRG